MASLGGRRFTAVFVGLLALGIAASYSNSLGIGFYFDDRYGIHNNPSIRSLRNIPSFFTDPHAFWTDRTQADVRPVLLITYALNYTLSGLNPWSWHVLNLLLHLVAALLVFVLVRDHVWWPVAERGPSGEAPLPAAADFPYPTSLLATHPWLPLLVLGAWVAAALRVARRSPQVTSPTDWFR